MAAKTQLLGIAKTWATKQLAGWDDQAHRDLLARHGAQPDANGRVSAKCMTEAQLGTALDDYAARGWPRFKGGQPDGANTTNGRAIPNKPQQRKLRAMWYALADVGAVQRPASATACVAAIETWAKRQINHGASPLGRLDALNFASAGQLNVLTDELKAWAKRVGAKVY
jgi:hypothetical protein